MVETENESRQVAVSLVVGDVDAWPVCVPRRVAAAGRLSKVSQYAMCCFSLVNSEK